MVVVEGGALFETQVVAIAIVAIVLEERDVLETEAVDDPPDDRGLSRPGPARHSDHERDAMAEIISAEQLARADSG